MHGEIVVPDLKEAFYMVRNFWDKVSKDCIRNCSKNCDIISDKIEIKTSETKTSNDIQDPSELMNCLKIEYYSYELIDLDKYEHTGASLTDQ